MSKLSDYIAGVIDNRGKNPPYYSENGNYLVLDNFLINGERYPDQSRVKRRIDDQVHKTFIRTYANKHDLAVTLVGNGCGKCCLIPSDNWVIIQNTIGLKPKSNLDTNYLYYYLTLNRQRVVQLDGGSSQPNVRMDNFLSISVDFPKREVQQKIAAVLSSLDAKIECNNRINAELEAMAKTLYDYWFVQFDFPDKNGNPYKSSGGTMVWNKELKREIPAGWESGSLVDLGDIVGGSTPSTTDPENFSEQGTPWITPKDLADNTGNKFISRGAVDVSAQGLKSASLKVYPKETVLLSSRAPIGYMAIARNPVTTNQGFKSIIPNKGYSAHFVYYTLKNSMKTIVQYASGSTFKEVSGTVLKTVLVSLPDKKIVETYTKSVTSLFQRQDILEQENQHLCSLRDWLLPMLMNGQVRVS